MSYDSHRLASVSIPLATAALVHQWKAPSAGQLYDINLSTTTTWTGSGKVEVGVTGDADKFGELALGTTAAGTGLSARHANTADTSIVLPHADFAKGDNVLITYTAATAGAGQLTVHFQLGG